jgi:hypothetical protein
MRLHGCCGATHHRPLARQLGRPDFLRIGDGGVGGVPAVVFGLRALDEDLAPIGMPIAVDMLALATPSRAADQPLVKARIWRQPLRLLV